jgi:hypothetical protein
MFLYSIQFNSAWKSEDKKVGRRGPEFSSFKQISADCFDRKKW